MPRDVHLIHQGNAPRTNDAGRSTLPTPYPPMMDPCRVCPGRCCHAQVTVPTPDAVSMAATLGVPILSLVSPVPTTHARAFRVDADPRIHQRATLFDGRVELALRRTETGRCAFLADLDGFMRCGIYGVRPGACRTYPMAWRSGEQVGMPLEILCPVPYAVPPAVEAQLARDVDAMLDGWALHDAIIARWEAASVPDRSLDRFLAFAIEATRSAREVDVARIPSSADAAEVLRQVMVAAGAR